MAKHCVDDRQISAGDVTITDIIVPVTNTQYESYVIQHVDGGEFVVTDIRSTRRFIPGQRMQ